MSKAATMAALQTVVAGRGSAGRGAHQRERDLAVVLLPGPFSLQDKPHDQRLFPPRNRNLFVSAGPRMVFSRRGGGGGGERQRQAEREREEEGKKQRETEAGVTEE